ncbi:MAG: hypothetical protein SNH55_02500 [Rikenellaceae bacterium]
MKKLIKLSLALAVVAMATTSCNCFKKMAKNSDLVSVSCTPEVLVLNNGEVPVELTVDFPAKFFNKKAIVKVTPVFVYESGETAVAPFYLQGSKVKENYKVVDFTNGGVVTEKFSVKYTDEMRRSELHLRMEVVCKCEDCDSYVLVDPATAKTITKDQQEVLAANPNSAEAVQILRSCGVKVADGINTLQSDINYGSIMDEMADNYKRVTTTVEKADIKYSINSSRVNAKEVDSAASTAAFKSIVATNVTNDRAKQTLYANGYASPDGPEKFNDKLSKARSESGQDTMEKLLAEYGLDIDAASYGEDWAGFKELVASSDIEDKNLILQVLSLYDSSTQREAEIKNLSSVFAELKSDILPQLRRTQMMNKIDLQGKTDAEMLALVKANRYTDLNVEEILHICNNLDVNDATKATLLDYASKKYNDARCYNNLGVVYTSMGETEKASKAFDSAIKSGAKASELSKNMALLNLAEGDVDAAKTYAAGADASTKSAIAAAQGEYTSAVKGLSGYNAAIAYAQSGNYSAAKSALSSEKSADAEYLSAVIASMEGDVKTSETKLKSAIKMDKSLVEKAATDVNLQNLYESGFKL